MTTEPAGRAGPSAPPLGGTSQALRAPGEPEGSGWGHLPRPLEAVAAYPRADLRTLMAAFPTGVSVVTATARDGTNWGMTCTSLCSVSLEPPVLLVCLRCGSPTLQAVVESGLFAVNLLHAQARPTAELFASGAPDRFERVVWQAADGAAGPHLTHASHTVADCLVISAQVVGDHAVVLGKVDLVTPIPDRPPLLYGLRTYASWPGTAPSSSGPVPRRPEQPDVALLDVEAP